MGFVNVRLFAPLMRQRVLIAPLTSYGTYGEPAYGADVSYQCAVVGEQKMIDQPHGQEVPSEQAVYLMSAAAIRPEDRITLSTGDVGSTESFAINPKILAVERYPFLAGQFATVLRL